MELDYVLDPINESLEFINKFTLLKV